MRKFMKSFIVTATAAALFAGGVVIAAAVGTSGAAAGNLGTPTDQSRPAVSVLSVLGTAQRPSDSIPKGNWNAADKFGESGLNLSSTRLLGKGSGGAYWAGKDNSGNVCLIVGLPSGGMGSGCTTVKDFLEHGVATAYEEPQVGEYAEAYLLPDGVKNAAPVASLTALGTNLITGDTRGLPSAQRTVSLKSADGTAFPIHLLDPVSEPK
jgi:hypothetical protein